MSDHRVHHQRRSDWRYPSSVRQDGRGVRIMAPQRKKKQPTRQSRRPTDHHQRQSTRRDVHDEENPINDGDAYSEDSDSDGESTHNMGKDSGCTNCVSVFNILLGLAIVSLWVYCYVTCYTGKVILINFAAGAWAGGLVIISGISTFIYSCVWNSCMGICALSFNIFVIAGVLACAGISGMDSFIEYRIYKDKNYEAPSIDASFITDALKDALDDGDINEKGSNDDFAYDGAIIYGLITLCSLLVAILTIAWSCYFCVADDDLDDDEEYQSDEDEYTSRHRDNVSVRSPFTSNVPRGQMAENYDFGRRGFNSPMNKGHQPSRQYHRQEQLNWGYYDDYSLQPSRHATAYTNESFQPPLYEENDPSIAMSDGGWRNRDRYIDGGLQYHQRGPPPSRQKPRGKRDVTTISNPDYNRQTGIPRASSRYYSGSLPDRREFGRNQYSRGQRAYSNDDLAYNGQRRENEHSSRRVDVNPDRSWMYNYY
ncbi:uncharacterized protein LOC117101649 isoform X2 [Anneissia japonica]|uniref:uncharacterized protein LOC117101649 isoform X2 n=1 Tax=Anneissia japonica TaxID=1529436 RepID=UPI001425BAC7|nr:uncharacterized protein LOC117101649 isoform X2 [Anneissia japonica]